MLSNAYFLAKFRFDTAENDPAKSLQNNFAKFANFADPNHCSNLAIWQYAGAASSAAQTDLAGGEQPDPRDAVELAHEEGEAEALRVLRTTGSQGHTSPTTHSALLSLFFVLPKQV